MTGKTAGIMGTGSIGRAVAQSMCGFGVKIIGFNNSGRKFTPFDFEGGCLGLNDPAKATPKAELFHDTLKNLGEGVHDAPWVMKKEIPQGMAGNSTFIIKPWAAKEIIKAQDEIGWWPNDAIMCKQLCPWIRCYKPYLTKCQGIKSTTSK